MIFFCGFGGCLATAFGLGGGIVYNPVFMAYGLPPIVAVSTAMYMIFYAMASSSALFLSYGMINLHYALSLGLVSGIGIFVALHFLSLLVIKYKRQSFIVFTLGVVLIAATIIGTIFNANDMKHKTEQGINVFKGESLCS